MSGNDKNKKKSAGQAPNQKMKVLYQNLGGQWYAFTNVGDEVYFSKVNLKEKGGQLPASTNSLKKKPKSV